MRKTIVWFIVFLICFLGCAQNKPFVGKNIASIAPLKIVRHETPIIKRVTSIGETIGIFSAWDPTGISALASGLPYAAMGKYIVKGSVPDFGKLVTDKIVSRASTEIPNWPATTVEEKTIKDTDNSVDYFPGEFEEETDTLTPISGTLLIFAVNLVLHYEHGFVSGVLATMTDSDGNIFWQQQFIYTSKIYGRYVSIDKYESDNLKLLKEEIVFAAEKTVSIFIEHFKGPMWSSMKKNE